MKKSFQIFAAAALLVAGLSPDLLAQNTYRWRGQSGGNWSTLSNWIMSTPGNAPLAAASLPTADDDVIFDGSSFNANRPTVTIDVAASARNLDFSALSRQVILAVNQPLTVTGSLTLNANIVRRTGGSNSNPNFGPGLTAGADGRIIFSSSSLSVPDRSIRSAGLEFTLPVVFNGAGARWSLLDNMTLTRKVSFLQGIVVAVPSPDTRPPYDPDMNTSGFNPQPRLIVQLSLDNNSTTAIEGGSTASHVQGYLQITGADNSTIPGTIFLPVGDAGIYRPVGMQGFSSSTANFLVRYYDFNTTAPSFPMPSAITPGSILNSVSNKEYWWIGRSGGSASPKIILNAHHPDPLVREYYNLSRYEGLTIAGLHKTTLTWNDFSGSASTASWNITAANAINENHGWYTIARRGVSPLPVRLVSFTARLQQDRVQLGWLTASEENSSHFEVERSSDGRNFTTLATVNAQGNSSSPVTYAEADMSPLSATSYYRLRMVDLDGTFSYSKTVAVSSASAGLQVRAYPNPSKGSSVHLSESTGAKLRLMGVTDMSGRAVSCQTSDAGADGLCLSFTSSLAPGFYLATLASSENGQPLRVKFTVQ